MSPHKPRIFVGSSTEAANVDRHIRAILENLQAEVLGWRDIFHAGDHPLDVLLETARSVDGALLIATPDDTGTFRGQENTTPRDNILVELGIFLSQLGKNRAALVLVPSADGTAARLPSDFHGITVITVESDKPANNEWRLKSWIDRVREHPAVVHPATVELQALLRRTLKSLPTAWHEELDRYVLHNIREAIHLASHGHVLLSPGQYYSAIYSEIDNASHGTEILAVATLSSAFWSEDRDQVHYLKKNQEAVERGATIRRLFVVPESQWNDLTPILRPQLLANIQVRRAVQRLSDEALELEDMVMFLDTASGMCRTFIADPAFDNPRRIRRARLLLDLHERNRLHTIFEQAWATAPVVTLYQIDHPNKLDISDIEPALSLKDYLLDKPVISCKQAAAAKCIPLENELKTLILATSRGYVALNLPGDAEADLRSVKAALEVEQAHLASLDELKTLGLSPGTVCAVKRPVWDLPLLISRRLLRLAFVSTNNGTLRGFFKFEPSTLLTSQSVMIGDFEKAIRGSTLVNSGPVDPNLFNSDTDLVC
jgi:prolyl-tRNA editing enzyme YbaK/EbsC (Cys-tRNA(Pro) deacylase)